MRKWIDSFGQVRRHIKKILICARILVVSSFFPPPEAVKNIMSSKFFLKNTYSNSARTRLHSPLHNNSLQAQEKVSLRLSRLPPPIGNQTFARTSPQVKNQLTLNSTQMVPSKMTKQKKDPITNATIDNNEPLHIKSTQRSCGVLLKNIY